MQMGDVIGFAGLGVLIIGQIVATSLRQGRLEQKLTDLCEHVNKQNGRIAKLEEHENDCARDFEHRVSKLDTNQVNVMARLDKIELADRTKV
jgi:hypothetical protein